MWCETLLIDGAQKYALEQVETVIHVPDEFPALPIVTSGKGSTKFE